VPAYVVFPDKTLIEMAEKRPATLDQMAGITGVGATEAGKLWAVFLEVITGAADQLHPGADAADRATGGLACSTGWPRSSFAGAGRGWDREISVCTQSTLRQIVERRPGRLSETGDDQRDGRAEAGAVRRGLS
jgi:ATP-dependent DNA helicase RecQ